MKGPKLIAHRGYADRRPENTFASLLAAVGAGARYIEFDVQMTADGVAVLLHDVCLSRTTGVESRIMDMAMEDLPEVVPSLEQVATWLRFREHVVAFVELKRESLEHFGRERVVRQVLQDLGPVLERCVIISFDHDSLELARARGASVGLVLSRYDGEAFEAAAALGSTHVFCDHELLPADGALEDRPWAWAIYDVKNVVHALELHRRGAAFIETMNIGGLRADLARTNGA